MKSTKVPTLGAVTLHATTAYTDDTSIVGLHYTVEPPNRGHFGTAAFVLSSEVVLFSEVV